MILETLAQQLNVSPEILVILIIWTLLWKGLSLWKSASLQQPIWFVILLIINTLGILEIIYLIMYSQHSIKEKTIQKRKSKRKR